MTVKQQHGTKQTFGTVIARCSKGCVHKFQDREYGTGRRLHNRVKGDPSQPKGRCTVCGTVNSVAQ